MKALFICRPDSAASAATLCLPSYGVVEEIICISPYPAEDALEKVRHHTTTFDLLIVDLDLPLFAHPHLIEDMHPEVHLCQHIRNQTRHKYSVIFVTVSEYNQHAIWFDARYSTSTIWIY